MSELQNLTIQVKLAAKRIGFDLVGIAPAASPPGFPRLDEWLKRGFAGEMSYLPRRRAAYEHPEHVMPDVRSVIMLGINYRTDEPAQIDVNQGRVARYAWNECDYHDLLRDWMREFSDYLHQSVPGCRTRAIVDTAPLLERDFARLAGLGWFGKNTMMINKSMGSWFFLAAVLTDIELEPDQPHETAHCGTCTRCLEVCPTNAFSEPYVLDARKCISYLTIESKSSIPLALRDGIGEWMFGCDLCQDVCPWNRKAPKSTSGHFEPRADLNPVDCVAILQMTRQEFELKFADSPLGRPGFGGLRRNAAIVLGNCGDQRSVNALIAGLNDDSSIVRVACVWSLGQLGGDKARMALKERMNLEIDFDVRLELDQAILRLETT